MNNGCDVREVLDTRRQFRRTGEQLERGDDAGLFGPESPLWRLHREAVLLAGGGRALVLQVAHPLVAAGVAQHSNYQQDPWGRLFRSLDIPLRMIFGDTVAARRAAAAFVKVHERVAGVTEESAGRYLSGTPYDSRSEELKLWVHATLIDTAVLAYERFVRPLREGELDAYYADVLRLGDQFGIPRELQPPTWPEFRRYVADTLASDRIAATDTLRELGEMLREPPLPVARVPAARVLNLFTAATLPPALREELGLPWGRGDAAALRAEAAVVRRLLPLMPPRYRYFPAAVGAEKRLKRLRRERGAGALQPVG